MSQKKTRYCCVCRSKVDNSSKLIGFPKEESERKVWLDRLGVKYEKYKPYMRFCEVHVRVDATDCVGNSDNDSCSKILLQNTTNLSDTIETADKVHDHGQDLREKACVSPQEIILTTTSDEPEVETIYDLRCTDSPPSPMMIHTSPPICTNICSDSSVASPKEIELPEQSFECSQSMSITPTHSREVRWLRYFGDIKTPDIQTPRGAKRCLDLARDTISKAKKKIKKLEARNYYLQRKVITLSESLQEARNQHSPTEDDFATLKGKAVKKLNPSKINHPNSRKAQQYVKFKNKEAKRDKKKLSHFVKLNHHGEKVLWFRDNLDPEAQQYTPSMVNELIEKYLGRFDEEMSIIQSVKPYEKQKYASRRDQIRHTVEDERNEYNGCGFEIPDILNQAHLEALRKWTGELRFLQNIPMVRYSKIQLLGNSEKL